MVVGFMAARSHDLIAVEACPVLAPGLDRAPAVAQMLGPRRGARREGGEVVEGLVVELEVRPGHAVLAVECRLPGAAVPCPAHALPAEQVADRRGRLRRQGRRLERVGIGGVALRGRRVGAPLRFQRL